MSTLNQRVECIERWVFIIVVGIGAFCIWHRTSQWFESPHWLFGVTADIRFLSHIFTSIVGAALLTVWTCALVISIYDFMYFTCFRSARKWLSGCFGRNFNRTTN